MSLFPDPGTLVAKGLARAFRGLRTGDQATLLAGAAVAAFGWWRSTTKPSRTLIRREVLKPGQSLIVRSHDGDSPPLRIDA